MRTIHRDIVGAFIFSADDKLLLGKSRNGGVYKDMWIIPGGGIEPGETLRQAVKRETLEEVGIDISPFKITEFDEILTGESEKILRDTQEKVLVKMNFHNFIVHTDMASSEIKIVCDDDLVMASWISTKELANLELSPPTKTTLKKLKFI